VLLIDGGKGQLAEAAERLDELGVAGVTLIGVAKGADRRPGQEQLFALGRDTPTILPPDSAALALSSGCATRRIVSPSPDTDADVAEAPIASLYRNHPGLGTGQADASF